MIEVCLFDFDGTLSELTLDFSDLRREVEEITVRYVPESLIRGFDHLYILEMIYEVEKRLGPNGEGFRRETFARLRELEVEKADANALYPYTRDVLTSLRRRGILVGVVTRNCRAAVKKVFPDIETYVDMMATREDVSVVKPDPIHIVTALDMLGNAERSKALLVGDHPTDIRAGRAAGIATAGVLTGRTKSPAFEEAGATFIIKDIRGVLPLLGKDGLRRV